MKPRTSGHQRWAKLPPDLQAKLDALVKQYGFGGAERRLGVTSYTLERLAWGGAATPSAVERCSERLRGYAGGP